MRGDTTDAAWLGALPGDVRAETPEVKEPEHVVGPRPPVPIAPEGPLYPRNEALQPQGTELQPWAVRPAVPDPRDAPPLEPAYPPGAPELLEKRATALDRRSGVTLLVAPLLAITTVETNTFGLVALLLGLVANALAVGSAFRERSGPACTRAGYTLIAYTVAALPHAADRPTALLVVLPLGLAMRWLSLAAGARREARRIVYAARGPSETTWQR